MQGMLSAIDTLASGGDPSVDSAKDRAKWFSGIGIAGPGLVGGSILLLNKIAIAVGADGCWAKQHGKSRPCTFAQVRRRCVCLPRPRIP